MNTIGENWELFAGVVIPKDAPEIQRREMRMAFFLGAESVLRIMFQVGEQNLSDAAGAAILDGMNKECAEFSRQYGAQRGLPAQLVDALVPAEKRSANA